MGHGAASCNRSGSSAPAQPGLHGLGWVSEVCVCVCEAIMPPGETAAKPGDQRVDMDEKTFTLKRMRLGR